MFEINDSNSALQVVHCFIDEDEQEDLCSVVFASMDLCVAGHRGLIKILDVQTGLLKSVLSGHGGPVYEIAMHATDSDLVFTCSKDESLGLWSLSQNRRVAIFAGDQGHRDAVLSLDVSDQWLLSSGMDNTIRLWALDERIHNAVANCRAKGPDYRAIFVQFPQFITRRVHSDYVDCARWVGNAIMTKSLEGRLIMWHPDRSRRPDAVCVLNQYQYKDTGLWFVRFGLDYMRERVAVGGDKGTIYVFDVDSAQLLQEIAHPLLKSCVRQVAFSDNGKSLVAIADSGEVWTFRQE